MCQLDELKGLIYDPNIWIGDTGASTHSTAHVKDAGGAAAIQVIDSSAHKVDTFGIYRA